MTDKEYFLQAETEFESENYDDAVLAKANHFSRGNKDNLKHKYIELRVEDLTESAARMKKDKIISQATEYGKSRLGGCVENRFGRCRSIPHVSCCICPSQFLMVTGGILCFY